MPSSKGALEVIPCTTWAPCRTRAMRVKWWRLFALVIMVLGASARVCAQTTVNPVDFVDPFIGTGGTSGVGLIDDFPGASAPFGMVQWSPDTPSQPPSGGYFYRDSEITGFSLTHLAGAGCQIFGDFAVLPTVGAIVDPTHAAQRFSHAAEQASPGYYSVRLGQPGIDVQLAATLRTGIGAFTFPATRSSNLQINAASDQAGVSDATISIVGAQEVAGSATSGGFCGMPNVFTIYFDMQFDRPFIASGTWSDNAVTPNSLAARGTQIGAWFRFDTTQNRTVRVKSAVSYVSVEGARKNVAALRTWDVQTVRGLTAASWNALLGEVRITGGSAQNRRMLYTSLYHALLAPTVYSDTDGTYRGFDDRLHVDSPGHDEYTNYSGWDIYRTQVPLMALLAPRQTSDMMRSLVHDAQQGGWLPKWPVANGYTGVMGGDPADAIIAAAYAYGAQDFDHNSALRAMLKGANDTTSPLGQGWYHPRPGLGEYLKRGYVVNTHTTSVSPVPNGASETLEYAFDDFSIAQFARSVGRDDIYRRFRIRSQNWTTLFETSTGLIMPRDADGAFMHTPITENGQSGFQEGNAAQYTWMVPHALGTLVAELGGPGSTVQRLDGFFTQLNAGQDQPYAWFGNEPSLVSPWVYANALAPQRGQSINREVMRRLYAPTPDGIPGNDDLGTMSAWWVWNALGLYPANPAVPILLLGAPLFQHVTITSPSRRILDIDAPQSATANDFVTGVRVNGVAQDRAWIVLPNRGVLTVEETVAAQPSITFGTSQQSAPPQYAPPQVHFPASTSARLMLDARTLTLSPGASTTLEFAIDNSAGRTPAAISWRALRAAGISLSPGNGHIRIDAAQAARVRTTVSVTNTLTPGLYDIPIVARTVNGAVLQRVTPIIRVANAGQSVKLGYVADFSDATVTPFDPGTHAYGAPIPVGKRPGGLAMSPDGARLFTANQGSGDVTVVDTRTQNVMRTIKVGQVPAGIHVSANGKSVWVSNYEDGTIQRIDATTLQPDKPIPVGSHPEELTISPDSSRVYVVNQRTSDVAVVDVAARKVLASIPVGRHPLGIVIDPAGKRIYVTNAASNNVSVIDAQALTVVAQIPVGKTPQGIAVSPDGGIVYVADSASMSVTPIDARTNSALAPISVGNGPFDVAFSSDGRYAYAALSGDNACAVIDVMKNKAIDFIPTGSFPIAMAIL
jgi:predicted alpha-1,2-mannosidase